MSDARVEARQRNRRAVQRLFAEKQRQRPPSGGSIAGSGGLTASAASSRQSSSMTLAAYQAWSADGADGASRAGGSFTGSYGGPASQPGWVQVGSRDCLREPSLDVPSHLSQQLQLGAELAAAAGGGGGDGDSKRDEQAALLARATRIGGHHTIEALLDPQRSCFALHLAKHQHRVELSSADATASLTQHERIAAQRALYHHQQAILRNETALARKRAASCYTSLTGAQADATFAFPNAHTLDRLTAERYRGRWPLDNPHRQQLLRGEPVMTQVMRGDFYESHRGRQHTGRHGAGPSPSPSAAARGQSRSRSAGRGRPVNAQQLNKRDVRVASAINASVRRAQSCEQRRAQAGGCYCAAPVPAPS